MSQSAQDVKPSSAIGFTSVQAYTLAVITLVIGIAVGYFARGSAPATPTPEVAQSAPAAAPASGAGMAAGQLPGIGTQQQGASSPEMLAKAAEPLLAKLKDQSQRRRRIAPVGQYLLRRPGLSRGH